MEAQAPRRVTVKQPSERKDLILATRPYAHEQRARSWMHLFLAVSVLVGCYLGVILLDPLWSKAVFGILAGLSLVRVFILYHDHQHKSILNRSKPADVFFWFFGMWMLSPPSIWKRSHDHHHKHNSKLYTSSIGSFPVVTVEKYKTLSPGERFAYNFIRSPFAIAFGYLFVFIIGMCLNSFISNKGKHWDSLITLVFHAALGWATWYFLGWEDLVFAFFLPYLVTFSLGSYLFYAQHNFPGTVFADKNGWSYVKEMCIRDSPDAGYPYTIQYQGSTHAVINDAGEERVVLMKVSDANDALVEPVVMLNMALHAPSLFEHGGRWWLMGTSDPAPNAMLRAFHAQHAEGPYTEHACSPLKCDARHARPAGTPFVHAGQLYRPALDASDPDHPAVWINRIDQLDPQIFLETPVRRIDGFAATAYGRGVRTISAMGDVTLVDGLRSPVLSGSRANAKRGRSKHRSKQRTGEDEDDE